MKRTTWRRSEDSSQLRAILPVSHGAALETSRQCSCRSLVISTSMPSKPCEPAKSNSVSSVSAHVCDATPLVGDERLTAQGPRW